MSLHDVRWVKNPIM